MVVQDDGPTITLEEARVAHSIIMVATGEEPSTLRDRNALEAALQRHLIDDSPRLRVAAARFDQMLLGAGGFQSSLPAPANSGPMRPHPYSSVQPVASRTHSGAPDWSR